jgi:hypothetical protein
VPQFISGSMRFAFVFFCMATSQMRPASSFAQSISGPQALSRDLMNRALADLDKRAQQKGLKLSLSSSTQAELQKIFDEGAEKIPWTTSDPQVVADSVKRAEANALIVSRAVAEQGIKDFVRGGNGKQPSLRVSKESVGRALAPTHSGQKKGICPGLYPFC